MRGFDIVRLINKCFFILLLLLFLFLPGENFYEKLRLTTPEPLVRKVEINLPQIADYPLKATDENLPFLTARSAIIIDTPSKVVMLEKNADQRLPPASTTKMMTGLVALENYQLDDVLIVPPLKGIIGRHMDLKEGEKITVENLLYGVLVQSGNDAALTLAANYPGGVEQFVALMNQKAHQLNLTNTHFNNISGLDQVEHYSTVRDLANLAAFAMENPTFAKMVNISRVVVADIDFQHRHLLESTNELIGQVMGLKGVKTGWTEAAGECLVSCVERDDRRIIIAILDSQDRFGETKSLIEWAFRNFTWEKIIEDR